METRPPLSDERALLRSLWLMSPWIAQALKPVITDVSTNLESFSKKVLKRPGTMSFKERVSYAQKHQAKYQGTIKKAPSVKAPVKS